MLEQLKKALSLAVEKQGIANPMVNIEYPEDNAFGDFSTNIALVYSKQLKISPKALAEKIVGELNNEKIENVKSIEIAGPGFINFHLSIDYIVSNIKDILNSSENFGRQNIGGNKKVLVEYSSPNIAKPFTVGHLRSTIIGDSIANILDFLGYKVIRDNHLGDWGTQFGKLLYAIDDMKLSSWDKIENSPDPIKELVYVYVGFHDEVDRLKEKGMTLEVAMLEEGARAMFAVLEASIVNPKVNQEILAKWKKCIDLSKKEFNQIYNTLGVKFDEKRGDTELGESFFVTPDKINPVMEILKEKNLLKTSEGAQVIFFDDEKYPPFIIQKTNGTSIYAARDLATDYYRKNTYGDDVTIINEVGSEQILHFRQLFEVEKMLGWFKDEQRVHVAHGLYRFKEGKMSTRKGNVIWLKDIIDEAEKRASVINPESAHDVAIGAIKFNDLKRDCAQDITFNWDEMMNMTGDSGPYLQYSCVRAEAIINKASEKNLFADPQGQRPNDINSLDLLERYMVHFLEVIAFSGSVYKPNIIATYLINLASLFNGFYGQTVIVNEKDETTAYKLAVTKAFTIIMKNGLSLLGIKVPERM